MGKLKQLTQEEAEDRLAWLRDGVAGRELDLAMDDSIVYPEPDAKVIEKLIEIKRVAAEVANFYTVRGQTVTWEIGNEEAA